MSEDQLRSQLYGAFANRAHIYHLLFTQLQSELGTEKAAELMGRAIYQRGVQQAAKYASFAPRDLAGLGRAFVANLPDDGAMFGPKWCAAMPTAWTSNSIAARSKKPGWMPTWQEEVATLCRIAAQVDSGMFEGAGFRFHADTYRPGAEGCCFLHVRAPNSGPGKRARRTFPAQRISASPASSVNTYPYFRLGGVSSLPAHPVRTRGRRQCSLSASRRCDLTQ